MAGQWGQPAETWPDLSHVETGNSTESQEAAARLESIHQDWNSSDSSTEKPGSAWESPDKELEDKMKRVQDPERDALPVGVAHAILEEKAARKEEKIEKNNKKRKAEANLRWSPLTKQGYKDFLLHCEGGQPIVESVLEPSPQRPVTPEAPEENLIRWGPVTKQGRQALMSKFGQEPPNLESMNLGDLVDFAIAANLEELPDGVPPHVVHTLHHIHELYHYWQVVDIEDID